MLTTCIVLSAGSSSRFGSPKALTKTSQGNVLIQETTQKLLHSGIHQIIIVLGSDAEKIQPFVLKHKKVKVVYNKHYNFGQTSSFKCGLKSAPDESSAFMLLPIDFPSIECRTIELLISEHSKGNASITIPTYHNKKGHPPLFDATLKKDFFQLDDSEGINSLSHHYQESIQTIPVNDIGVILTFNTQEELDKIRELKEF